MGPPAGTIQAMRLELDSISRILAAGIFMLRSRPSMRISGWMWPHNVRQAFGVLIVAVISLISTACSSGGAASNEKLSKVDQSCNVSMLQLGPDGFAPYGLARAGPVWISAFGRVDPGTPAVLAAGGGPYDGWKVVLHPDPSSNGTINLSGTQCSSGKDVRFCYGGCDWNSRLQLSVTKLSVDVSAHLDYTGYMVFPGPGLMRISVSDAHGNLGSVVIEVPQVLS
jgi:hypothetical protein